MKKIFTDRFKDTERTTEIGEKVCEHTFELLVYDYPWRKVSNGVAELLLELFNVSRVKRYITIRITSENSLNPAVIEHFKRWKHSSLSQSEREELYHIYKLTGIKGEKVVKINDSEISIKMKTELERYYPEEDYKIKSITLPNMNHMMNTKGLVAFYKMLA